MTIKEAFLNYRYIVAPLPIAQRTAAANWLQTHFPNDQLKVLPTGLETVALKTSSFTFFFGFTDSAEEPNLLLVNSLTKFQNGLLAIKERRISIPITSATSRHDVSLYTWNGNVYIPDIGVINNADFQALTAFVRNDNDPEL